MCELFQKRTTQANDKEGLYAIAEMVLGCFPPGSLLMGENSLLRLIWDDF